VFGSPPPPPVAQRLLQCALAIVDRDGLEALTIRALVQESGISNGSVYHHFGSLEQLRSRLAIEALKMSSQPFFAALHKYGYAAAADADMRWTRAHPELAMLIEAGTRSGTLGQFAPDFGNELRRWLDQNGLAIGASSRIASAIVIGPLLEFKRLQRATGMRPRRSDFDALQTAVIAALKALSV
jgi:AcrR family transcriptional regulator